jgi:stage II sporulation protein D
MLRRLLAAFLLLVTAAAAAAASARTKDDPPLATTSFVFTGHGWGHGVGMAQYGALGYARQGVTYDRILKHYYRGVTIGPAPVSKVRVLVAENRAELSVTSDASFKVRDGSGDVLPLDPGTYAFGPALRLRSPASVGQMLEPLSPPVTFVPGRSPLRLDRPYRGSIRIDVTGKRLQAVDIVGLDAYIRGVVSGEMPHDWPLEAVKAQAVAARSYALSQRRQGQSFDVYADTRDQVYGGIDAETPVGDAAVAATEGQVLLYRGKVIVAYFCSSSGGRTASLDSLYPDRKPLPYLVSVPDPWDKLSPYHDWGPVVFTDSQVSNRLGFAGVEDVRPLPPGGHAAIVDLVGVNGEATVAATDFRRALELRSTWFSAGIMTLARPAGTVASGATVTLTGFVKRLAGATLEERAVGGTWQPGPLLQLGQDGSFTVAVTPPATTDFRLAAGTAHGAPLRVPVK